MSRMLTISFCSLSRTPATYAMVVPHKRIKRRDHETTRRDVLRTKKKSNRSSFAPTPGLPGGSEKSAYTNREGKETEKERMSLPPFETAKSGPKTTQCLLFEIELPSRDIGIEFKEVKGARFACMVSKVERTSRAFGKVKEGDLLTRVTATQIHEKVPETQATTILDPWKWNSGWFECKDESFDDVLAAIRSTAVVSAGYVHKLVRFEFLRTEEDVTEKEEEEEEERATELASDDQRVKEKEEESKEKEKDEEKESSYREALSHRGKLEADREAKHIEFPKEEIEGGFAKDEDSKKLFKEETSAWDD